MDDDSRFETAQGLYWFAADNHAGQTCPLYGILSTLTYSPSPMESGPDAGISQDIYDRLSAMPRHAALAACEALAEDLRR